MASSRGSKGVFNLARYRVKGNGIADDTLAIQRCIDDAEDYVANRNTAATINFPAGIYPISDSLIVKEHNVHLVGVGGGSDLFVSKGSLILPVEDFPNNKYAIRFDWVNKSSALYGNRMINLNVMPLDGSYEFENIVNGVYWGVTRGFMSGCFIDSLSGLALGIQGHSTNFKSLENRFLSNHYRRCANGVQYLGSSSDQWFDKCYLGGTVTGAGLNGLGANNYYDHCHFTGNKNNIVSGDGGSEELFDGCNFETPREHNILLDCTGGAVSAIRIVNCQFNSNALTSDNTYDTIYVGRASGSNTVSGEFKNNTFAGDGANKPRYHINLSGAAAFQIDVDGPIPGSSSYGTDFLNHNSNAVRCLTYGMGRNVGNPASTGAWQGRGVPGIRVQDSGGATVYQCLLDKSFQAMN